MNTDSRFMSYSSFCQECPGIRLIVSYQGDGKTDDFNYNIGRTRLTSVAMQKESSQLLARGVSP
jgi:hypothetical protein